VYEDDDYDDDGNDDHDVGDDDDDDDDDGRFFGTCIVSVEKYPYAGIRKSMDGSHCNPNPLQVYFPMTTPLIKPASLSLSL